MLLSLKRGLPVNRTARTRRANVSHISHVDFQPTINARRFNDIEGDDLVILARKRLYDLCPDAGGSTFNGDTPGFPNFPPQHWGRKPIEKETPTAKGN